MTNKNNLFIFYVFGEKVKKTRFFYRFLPFFGGAFCAVFGNFWQKNAILPFFARPHGVFD